jgi:EAL domain-containing protein (putative c-di-GMP-specific phosphodiesterase class I)
MLSMVSPLITARPSAGVTRRLLAACAVSGAIAVVIALSAGSGRPPAAEPACIAIASVCAALVAHLLHASARALGEGRLEWMAAGVTLALAGMVAKGLGLPVLFGVHAPVTQQADALSARYLVWHAGLLCAAVLALAGVAPRRRAVTLYAVFWGGLLAWTCVSTEPFGDLVPTGTAYDSAFHIALAVIAVALLAAAAVWWWRTALSWAEQCVVAGLLLAAGGAIAVLFAGGPHAAAWWAELTLRAMQFAVPAVGLLISFIAVADRVSAFQRELSGHLAADRLRAGRERRLWGSDAARRARRRRQLERLIAGEGLAVALQPIVELDTRQVVGAEALARFTGSGGVRIPTEGCFLDAMALGLGPALELAVVRRALTVGHRLPAGLYLALNVSPQVLESVELEEILAAQAGDRPLVVELTEHQAVEDYASLTHALDRLRTRGIRVAIDDVGSGFASFRHVTRVQPDILKLDRTLVSGIDDDPVRQSLASAIVTFARDVGATVVSEGIESLDELTCLKDLEVRCGQGFYLSRPQLGSVESQVPEPVAA